MTGTDATTRTTERDAAAYDGMGEALARLAPAIDRFARFPGPDRAVTHRRQWKGTLDIPLPRQGAGLDTVLDELAVAAEFGCRVAHPGFSGFVTTGASTSAVAAAATVAALGGQRYLL